MTTSRLTQIDPTAYWGREQTRKRRDERRAAVIAYLDHVDRPRAVGMTAREIATRTGLSTQSVAQTLAALVDERVAVKQRDGRHTQSTEPLYFLAPKRKAIAIDSAARAAIELYRAEKAKRSTTQRDVIAEARAELERLDSLQQSQRRYGRNA